MIGLSYDGRRAIVTGCYSGIGRATAELLLSLGAEVHGIDIRANDLPFAGFHATDLRDPAAIDRAVTAIGGRVDALFNCAGLPPGPQPLDVVKVNFAGTRHLTGGVLTLMGEGGAVVNVASNGGAGWRDHLPDLQALAATTSFDAAVDWFVARLDGAGAAYSLSKEAIIVWTMQSASTLIKRGIRVNCTRPGAVQTPMLDEIERTTPSAVIDRMAEPIGRRSTAEEQAWPLVFLGSHAASYLNGAVLPVDGGFMGMRALIPPTSQEPIGRK